MIDPKTINHLNYVVQRNWDNLPTSFVVDGHDDLDLYVSEEDREELEEIIGNRDDVDIRSPLDDYYPDSIQDRLLQDRRTFNGFWIPSKESHFLSLYYHNVVHKDNNPYERVLKRLFLDIHSPRPCVDKGVGYYV